MADKNDEGFLLPALVCTLDFASRLSSVISGFYRWKDFEQAPSGSVRRVDRVLLGWWIATIGGFLGSTILGPLPCLASYPALVLFCWRAVNIVLYNLRVALVPDRGGAGEHLIVSNRRSLTFGMINFVELVVCFAYIYAMFPDKLAIVTGRDWFSALYFSFTTQLTIGFGDVAPTGGLRAVACIQGLLGLFLLTLTIGRFASVTNVREIRKKENEAE